jgi:hypothetical protein
MCSRWPVLRIAKGETAHRRGRAVRPAVRDQDRRLRCRAGRHPDRADQRRRGLPGRNVRGPRVGLDGERRGGGGQHGSRDRRGVGRREGASRADARRRTPAGAAPVGHHGLPGGHQAPVRRQQHAPGLDGPGPRQRDRDEPQRIELGSERDDVPDY